MKDVRKQLETAQRGYTRAAAAVESKRAEIASLQSDAAEARAAEQSAAVAALDSGDGKAVAKATAKIREIEDRLRVAQIQLVELEARLAEASSRLDEAQGEQRASEQAADYEALQAAVADAVTALTAADAALRAAKSFAVGIVTRYRAAGGRDASLHSFTERLRQLTVDNLREVDLLERNQGARTADPVGALAGYVSDVQFISSRERNAA